MTFTVLGLNYKTAALELREKLALSVNRQIELQQQLVQLSFCSEVMILMTCNRTEFYCSTDNAPKLHEYIATYFQLNSHDLNHHFYYYHDNEALSHALSVAVGIDSMMLGEPQILGQMKNAYSQSLSIGALSLTLKPIFDFVFHTAKRIRRQSGIGLKAVSIAYAAAKLIKKSFDELSLLKVFVIGSGDTATLVIKHLKKLGIQQFYVSSKTPLHALQLANSCQGEALNLSKIPEYIQQADIVITATSCPVPFIDKNLIENIVATSAEKKFFFLDLAVPRDIEPEVADISNVQLFNIDNLEHIVNQNKTERKMAASYATDLIKEALNDYDNMHRLAQAKDLICDYRGHMQTIADEELTRAYQKLAAGADPKHVLAEICTRLVNKFTHHPTMGLKKAAIEGREELFDLTQYLFNTNTSPKSIMINS